MQGEPGVGIKGEKGDSGPPGSRVSDNGLYYYSNTCKIHVGHGSRTGHDAVMNVCFYCRDQMASKVHLGLQA